MFKTKKFAAMLLVVVMMLSSASAFACTGFYVGKQASANGTTIIGHTVDAWTTAQGIFQVVPAVENEPGRTLTVGEGVEYPLPDTTFHYTSTPFTWDIYDGGVANENGVAISSAVTCYTTKEIAELDPLVRNGGLSEMYMCAIVGATATSARHAVEILGDYIATYGSAENNSFFIADQNEAWCMETYTGHEWCAVKMPEDCIAIYGNNYLLGAVDANSEDVMYSPNLFTMPEEAGLAVYTEDGMMDLYATYAGNVMNDGSNRRTWYGHVLFAPDTVGEYVTEERYNYFYQPAEKVTLNDILEMTRSRYEGTEFCPETNDVSGMRVIGIERQVNCNAIEVYDNLPAEMACVTWACMANAEHSVYLPMSNLITDVSESYSYIPEQDGVNLDLVHYNYKRLCALAEQDRYLYGTGVRAYWKSVEDALIAEYPDVLAATLELYNSDPAAAAEYITEYTIGVQDKALKDAKLMFDELTWYMITNTNTTLDLSKVEPFTPSIMVVEEAETETAA